MNDVRTPNEVSQVSEQRRHADRRSYVRDASSWQQNIESEIRITPDMTGLIIGVNWLRKRRHFVWDFDNHPIKFSEGG